MVRSEQFEGSYGEKPGNDGEELVEDGQTVGEIHNEN